MVFMVKLGEMHPCSFDLFIFHLRRMSQYQEDTKEDVLTRAEKLQREGWESYLNP